MEMLHHFIVSLRTFLLVYDFDLILLGNATYEKSIQTALLCGKITVK